MGQRSVARDAGSAGAGAAGAPGGTRRAYGLRLTSALSRSSIGL
jgi:hypothetical protein